jgi:hypothetical protein
MSEYKIRGEKNDVEYKLRRINDTGDWEVIVLTNRLKGTNFRYSGEGHTPDQAILALQERIRAEQELMRSIRNAALELQNVYIQKENEDA